MPKKKTVQSHSRLKAHQVYKTKNGLIVPGVTTITGQIISFGMVVNAVKLTKDGLDYKEVWDEKKLIGTCTHLMIQCHHEKTDTELSDFTQQQIDKAENCFLAYLEWEKNHDVVALHTERQMVSETFRYGGTADFIGHVDGELSIMDYKTGAEIYDSHYQQGAALRQLYFEESNEWCPFHILKLGSGDKKEDYRHEKCAGLASYWEDFYLLLQLWWNEKKRKAS